MTDTTPAISSWISRVSTVAFAMASVVAALLTVSTASLLTSGAISRPKSSLVSEPTRNLLVWCSSYENQESSISFKLHVFFWFHINLH